MSRDIIVNEKINDNDMIVAKFCHLKSAFDKTMKALDYAYETDVKTFDADDFDERIEDIVYTEQEILSLKSDGRMKDKYQIMKTVLSRFGITLRNQSKRIYKNKKKVRIPHYIIQRDQETYEIVHNIVKNDSVVYNTEFINMINTYDKYKNYMSKPKTKMKSLFVAQNNKKNNVKEK